MEILVETSPIIESTASTAVMTSKDAKAAAPLHHVSTNDGRHRDEQDNQESNPYKTARRTFYHMFIRHSEQRNIV